ncbi:MAG: hypothetical protein ACM30I_18385 [Gemmatimonas sp.]
MAARFRTEAIGVIAGAIASVFALAPVTAAEPVSFHGKTVTVIVGYGAGGRIDTYSRLLATELAQRLPGNPTLIVRNMLGADGVVALNYFYTQAKPDGLTAAVVGASQVDPFQIVKAKASYDVGAMRMVGGNGHSGTALVIRNEALPRLRDPNGPPAVMGALSAVRTGMQATLWGAEYLGWNAKWVVGYPTTKSLVLGVERGEIDMTSFSDIKDVQRLRDTGAYTVLGQTGYLRDGKLQPRPEYGAPLLSDLVADKITDPTALRAFAYWRSISQVGEFMALPPGTPSDVVDVYRRAFRDTVADADFAARLVKAGDEFLPQSSDDLDALLTTLAETPRDALAYLIEIARRQGLTLGE